MLSLGSTPRLRRVEASFRAGCGMAEDEMIHKDRPCRFTRALARSRGRLRLDHVNVQRLKCRGCLRSDGHGAGPRYSSARSHRPRVFIGDATHDPHKRSASAPAVTGLPGDARPLRRQMSCPGPTWLDILGGLCFNIVAVQAEEWRGSAELAERATAPTASSAGVLRSP
jgi:hypothetical protein